MTPRRSTQASKRPFLTVARRNTSSKPAPLARSRHSLTPCQSTPFPSTTRAPARSRIAFSRSTPMAPPAPPAPRRSLAHRSRRAIQQAVSPRPAHPASLSRNACSSHRFGTPRLPRKPPPPAASGSVLKKSSTSAVCRCRCLILVMHVCGVWGSVGQVAARQRMHL